MANAHDADGISELTGSSCALVEEPRPPDGCTTRTSITSEARSSVARRDSLSHDSLSHHRVQPLEKLMLQRRKTLESLFVRDNSSFRRLHRFLTKSLRQQNAERWLKYFAFPAFVVFADVLQFVFLPWKMGLPWAAHWQQALRACGRIVFFGFFDAALNPPSYKILLYTICGVATLALTLLTLPSQKLLFTTGTPPLPARNASNM